MANPGLSDDELRYALYALEASGGNQSEAARQCGLARQTFNHRVVIAKNKGLTPLSTPPKEREFGKPRVSVPAPTHHNETPMTRVLVIGDVHDDPRDPDRSRMKWMGRHANATKPDWIVQVGDWGTFDSCSTFEPNGTIAGQEKPSYLEDLESLDCSVRDFNQEIDDDYRARMSKQKRLQVTLGNHDGKRPERFENANPELKGMHAIKVHETFARRGWHSRPEGDYLFIGGVGFTHMPFNLMGKPYGGKHPENQIGNDAIFSIVYGHTHKAVSKSFPKIGPNKRIDLLNAGCALPHGKVEHYALKSTTGWTYCIYDIVVGGGLIHSAKQISMLELEATYG